MKFDAFLKHFSICMIKHFGNHSYWWSSWKQLRVKLNSSNPHLYSKKGI